jgi:hypothetical protein
MLPSPGEPSKKPFCIPTFRSILAQLVLDPEDGSLFKYRLHGTISQKMATFITTTVRTSYPACTRLSLSAHSPSSDFN